MSTTPASTAPEQALLAAARAGDEDAFTRLVEPRRSELHAHCYRMLGSVQDAEDALQDTMLRAWRFLPKFEGRSSLRSWLYRIATNVCLEAIARRPKRVLPVDYGAASDPQDGPGEPVVESVWVEPYPDEAIGVEDGRAAPEARYEQREGVELAFIAALQHLPPNQRAVLIMREVLGFSAREVGESLETSVASVNSALQRARKTVDERLPDQTQQQTARSLGDERMREIVEAYIDAMQRGDVTAVVGMLSEDAAWSMPPAASWYRGHDDLETFLALGPLSGQWRWRRLTTHANGQPAVGAYTWYEPERAYLPFALDVLALEGERISEITAFITRTTDLPDHESFARWPEHPLDRSKLALFESFGLPGRVD
jgi:RNA polymerase sigma-70 factor (ECF subfamily)